MSGKPYPPELVEEARRMHRLLGTRQISAALGVPRSTVTRWVRPGIAEQQRRHSRERRRAMRGVCELCGGETRWGGNGNGNVSRVCRSCNEQRLLQAAIAKRGSGPLQEGILRLLESGPKRYKEMTRELGVRQHVLGSRLERLLRYGLIERCERGLYRKAG